jgi:phospholipid/cholesterol/gamma-HCH transport system substrate-binding protein
MLSRVAKAQFAAFIVLTVIAVLFSLYFVGLPSLLGFGRNHLTVELPASGNLYPRAVVTLRGVPIGEVRELRLASTGVRAELSVRSEVDIPAGSTVTVRSISAIGEQYLDFEPRGAGRTRLLRDGDVVPANTVVLPVDVNMLLDQVNRLVASVPAASLNTTVDELSQAFTGTGPSLRWLLDSSARLTEDAQHNLAPTRALLDELRTVLPTQQRLSPRIHAIVDNLATFTDQLRSSDAQLRGAIERTPEFANAVTGLVDRVRAPLPGLLTELDDIGDVTRVYLPNLRETLTVLPTDVNLVQNAIYNTPIPGAVKIYLRVPSPLNAPPPCTRGFQGAHQRDPEDLSPVRPATGAFCDESRDSPIAVRGSRNSPCPNNPTLRSKDAAGCGLRFQDSDQARRATEAAVRTQLEIAARLPTTHPQPTGAPRAAPR